MEIPENASDEFLMNFASPEADKRRMLEEQMAQIQALRQQQPQQATNPISALLGGVTGVLGGALGASKMGALRGQMDESLARTQGADANFAQMLRDSQARDNKIQQLHLLMLRNWKQPGSSDVSGPVEM